MRFGLELRLPTRGFWGLRGTGSFKGLTGSFKGPGGAAVQPGGDERCGFGNITGTPWERLWNIWEHQHGNTGEHTFLWEHPRMFVDYIVLARTFVTLGPPRGCGTVRGGRRGGGPPATVTEGAGPGRAATLPKKRAGTRGNLRLSQKRRAGSSLWAPPAAVGRSAAAGAGAGAGPGGSGGPPPPPLPRGRARGGPRRHLKNEPGRAGICG